MKSYARSGAFGMKAPRADQGSLLSNDVHEPSSQEATATLPHEERVGLTGIHGSTWERAAIESAAELQQGEQRVRSSKVGADAARSEVAIRAWLRRMGVEGLTPIFIEHEVWVEALPHLTSEALDAMGITKVGPRCVLLAAITESQHARWMQALRAETYTTPSQLATATWGKLEQQQQQLAATLGELVAEVRRLRERCGEPVEGEQHEVRSLGELQQTVEAVDKGQLRLSAKVRDLSSRLKEVEEAQEDGPDEETEARLDALEEGLDTCQRRVVQLQLTTQ